MKTDTEVISETEVKSETHVRTVKEQNTKVTQEVKVKLVPAETVMKIVAIDPGVVRSFFTVLLKK